MPVQKIKDKDGLTTYSKTESLNCDFSKLTQVAHGVDGEFSKIFPWCKSASRLLLKGDDFRKHGTLNELKIEKFGQKFELVVRKQFIVKQFLSDGSLIGGELGDFYKNTVLPSKNSMLMLLTFPQIPEFEFHWKIEKQSENKTNLTIQIKQKPFDSLLKKAAFELGSIAMGFSFEKELEQMFMDISKFVAVEIAAEQKHAEERARFSANQETSSIKPSQTQAGAQKTPAPVNVTKPTTVVASAAPVVHNKAQHPTVSVAPSKAQDKPVVSTAPSTTQNKKGPIVNMALLAKQAAEKISRKKSIADNPTDTPQTTRPRK